MRVWRGLNSATRYTSATREWNMVDFDLVIRGGTVADGTGTGTREADVAVKDGKIAAVGKVAGTGTEEIAAKGLLVTPGFVDIHTHYDGQATWDSRLQPSSWHGGTTAAMKAGAIGFSTSRTLNHRTVKGDPTPSLRASEAELLGIALGMRDAGSGVIEFISDFNTPNPESEFEMIDRLLTASGRPFSVSLAQRHSKPDGWRRLLGLVEVLAAKGHAAKAQVAPRPIGVLHGLQASRIPVSMCRAYKQR